ncbi:MAG: rhomboid family intramembrane serine protease, partial [Elusimicrobia bacterium]|nr:rhomboid family intramembrane serine protease [Elusimicrobiota bacterium]
MTRFGHDAISLRRMSPGVKGLVIANAAFFLLGALAGPEFYRHFGLVPRLVVEQRWLWQPLTYMFVHGGFFHFFFNVFMLWMFGMAVESAWGTREFLKFYFLCGLGVAGFDLLIGPHSGVALIGASGAIYGLLVAFAMLYPDAVMYLYFLIPVKAAHMAMLCGLIELIAMITEGNRGVSRFAHLTGMAIGYVYIRWWWALKLRAKSLLDGALSAAASARPRPAPRPRAPAAGGAASMEDVDRVLDKILAKGLESLTE